MGVLAGGCSRLVVGSGTVAFVPRGFGVALVLWRRPEIVNRRSFDFGFASAQDDTPYLMVRFA
jgi:hypothetical protein